MEIDISGAVQGFVQDVENRLRAAPSVPHTLFASTN